MLGTSLCRLGALLAFCACSRAEQPRRELGALPEVTLHGVKLEHFTGSRLAALGHASSVTYERSSGHYTATAVAADLFRPGREKIRVEAAEVRGSLPARAAEGEDGVVVRSAELTATTERARFDGQVMRASGEANVRVEAPGLRLESSGFRLDLTDGHAVFEGGVRSRVEAVR